MPEDLERKKFEILAVLALTIFFTAISSWKLGSADVPVTSFKIRNEESFYIDLKNPTKVRYLYLLYKGELNFSLFIGKPDGWRRLNIIKVNDYYRWINLWVGEKTRFIKLYFPTADGEIVEIVAVDENDEKIKIHSIIGKRSESNELWKMIDEQEKVSLPPSYLTETYFDEIYYVRAAEDYLEGKTPYEWTHPPLGKLIIAAGISLFGYGPFSWRIMSVIFGSLLIPIIYLLGKDLFGTFLGGFIPAFLLTFDFMHYTLSRIAIIDTFLLFFLTTSHLFFYKYIKSMRRPKFFTSALPLAIAFFALGLSTKWTASLGFIGQFTILLLKRLHSNENLEARVKPLLWETIYTLTWSLLVIPLYLSAFIPYMAIGHSLEEVFQRQLLMLSFHSTLKTTHPFSSEWWSWPFILKPVWFYCSSVYDEVRSTITCMGNPAIWYLGFISIFLILFLAVKDKTLDSLFISTIFFSQWLPYALLSRPLFLYYFYPNVPFLSLAATFTLKRISSRNLGKIIVSSYLLLSAALFGLYFPVISGNPASKEWIDLLRILKSWIF